MKFRLNGLDRIVGYFAPAQALRRGFARGMMARVEGRGYSGAGRTKGSVSQWSALGGSADADTLMDLEALRARSRDLVRNDPLAQSGISTKVVNVIGPGHVVRPEINQDRLGLTEAEAEAWEARALDIWLEWSRSADCDVTRTQTFAGLEDLAYRSRLLSGDVFMIRRFKEREGRLLATCYQAVEADRVSNPNWKADSSTLAGGVELDADGAPLAYHVANRHIIDRTMAGTTEWRRVPAFDSTGRRLVLHIHGTRWRPDMTRYAPMLAPVIESLKQRSRYSEAELMAAVVSACFAIGMRSDDGDLGAGLANGSAQPSDSSGSGNPIEITEPGQVFDLMPGEEVSSFSPGRPNPDFGPFIEAVAVEVGAGTDLPYELLLKKFQASYSASRAAMEMAWQFFRADRALHVSQFCRPVYEDVITEAVARGLLGAPGFFTDPLRRQAWLGAEWMGPARPTIDPVKDATADEKYLGMGVTSRTRIAAERFGQDQRQIARRRARDGSDEVTAGSIEASDPAGEAEDKNDSDKETS
jgi:lambda family phage portal protein